MKTLLLTATLLAATSAVAAPDAPPANVTAPTAPVVAISPYDELVNVSRAQFEAKDFSGAQKTVEQMLALAQTPKEKSDALRRLGQTLDGQQKYGEAREEWQKMLPLIQGSPDDLWLTRLLITSTYFNEKMWQQVVDALPALIDDPHTENKILLQFQLAVAYSELKQGEKARAQLAPLIADQALPLELRNSVQLVVGESYLRESNLDAARQSLEATTEIKGVSGDILIGAYRGLGEVAEKQNRTEDAATAFAQARSLLMQKADGQFKAKDWKGSIESYKAALTTGIPDSRMELVAHMQLGTAYKSLGDTDAAIAEFQYVVDTEPSASDSSQPDVLKTLKPLAFMGLAQSHIAQKEFEPARAALNLFMEYDDIFVTLLRKQAEALLQSLPPKN